MNQLTPEDLDRFEALRERVYEGVAKAIEGDVLCDMDDGALRLRFPSYFGRSGGNCAIELACSVCGPRKHQTWRAKTWKGAIDKAFADVETWIAELEQVVIGE